MSYNYCPNCGQQASVRVKTPTLSICLNCQTAFWNNPRSTVAVLFSKADALLYSKRGIEPNKGKYDFPGGFVEYNESLEAACIREVQEETGILLESSNLQLIAIYTEEYMPGTSVTDHMYLVTQWSGNIKANDDSAALEWHPLSFINGPSFVQFYAGLGAIVQSNLAKHL